MTIINEIKRIQNLMLINEAVNPILNLFLEPQVKLAWNAFKESLGNSATRIGQSLDDLGSVANTNLRNLADNIGIYDSQTADLESLVNRIINSTLNQQELSQLIDILSQSTLFKTKIQEVLLSDKNFKSVIKQAIELEGEEGMSPQQIKGVLEKYIGEENADVIYNKMRAQFSPIPKVKPGSFNIEEFNLTPAIINDLVTTVDDVKLKKIVNEVLGNEQNLSKILRKAEELSKSGPLDINYFKKEFEEIVKSNPDIIDKATQSKIYLLTKKLIQIMGKNKNGKWSLKKIGAAIITGLVVTEFWTSSETKSAWRKQCFVSKGYDSNEKIATLKKDEVKYEEVKNSCDNYVSKKWIDRGTSNISSKFWAIVGGFENLFPSGDDEIVFSTNTETKPKDETKPEQTSKPDEIKPKTTEFKPQQQPKVPFEPKPNPEIPQTGSKL